MAEQIITELTVTEDGVYTAAAGTGYSPVVVSVEDSIYAQLLTQTWGS